MNRHYLYGVAAYTDVLLFDLPSCNVLSVSDSGSPVYVKRSEENRTGAHLGQTYAVPGTHGRELALHTDRPVSNGRELGQSWCMDVDGVVSFWWVSGGVDIEYQLHREGTHTLLAFWLVHIFLPLYLTLERGYDFIHAAAVELHRKSVLFVAPSEGGKSTMVAHFLDQGHSMLADDKVAVFESDGRYRAAPSHPHNRPYRQLEVFGDPVKHFASETHPIQAIYLLERADPDAVIEISEITGFRKFEQLVPSYLYGFRFLKEHRMRWLAMLSNQLALYQVNRPWNLARMSEVYDAICAHSHSLEKSEDD
ncbi:MAG: hypothetical protein AAF699_20740 [Pseudomonadota bacterium]